MKKRSGFTVMARLIGLVKPLSGYMVLAILMGLVGNLCAAFITIFGGFAVLDLLGFATPVALKTTFVCVLLFALVRGIFRYAEQSCNHFIAFKLLALIRDKVFRALRRLCPAKLEGRDRGDLISLITADIEALEVFYAHTISPICIACICVIGMTGFVASYHILPALVLLAGYLLVGVALPYTEVVSALQTNMIEGLTNDIFGYTYYDLPRQTRYMLPVPLGFCPQALVVNRKWWDSLPESERKALEFVIAATDVHQYFEDEEQRILKWWDENPDTILVKMTPEARAEWEAALRQATDEFVKGVDPALLEAIRTTAG